MPHGYWNMEQAVKHLKWWGLNNDAKNYTTPNWWENLDADAERAIRAAISEGSVIAQGENVHIQSLIIHFCAV